MNLFITIGFKRLVSFVEAYSVLHVLCTCYDCV